MDKRIIANPPISIYDQGETKIKHSTFLYLLDTYARFKELSGEQVEFPSRSYNVFGKKSAEWCPSSSYPEVHQVVSERVNLMLTRDAPIRKKMDLSSLEVLLDTDNVCVEGSIMDFWSLYDSGYVMRKGSSFYLDCPLIHKKFDLPKMLEGVKIFPQKAESEFHTMVERNTKLPIEITKETLYAPDVGLERQRLGPLFNLARMWSHKYSQSKVSLAASHNVLLKYAFLRFLTSVVLEENAGFDELLVWPKVHFGGGKDNWELGKFLDIPYGPDMLRAMLLSKYPSQNTDVNVSESDFRGSRNRVYLIANLRKPLSNLGFIPSDTSDHAYIEDMNNFKYPKVLQKLEVEAKEISHAINSSKDSETFESDKKMFARKYSNLILKLRPFMPRVFDLCKGELNNVI